MGDEVKWYVARVSTGSETKLNALCDEIGVESYCPLSRQKGPRRRGEQGREAIERPALQGYLPIKAVTVEASETREKLYRERDFFDFLRDVTNEIAAMDDEELNPLRAMEKAEPVKFISGPVFYIGEVVKVPYNNGHVSKAFWNMVGQVVGVKNGRYCLGGHDFTKETWFSGCQLLKPAV